MNQIMLWDIAIYVTLAVTVVFVGVPLAFLMGLIIYSPFGFVGANRETKRAIAVLAELPCPSCGVKFGMEVAEKVYKGYGESCAETRRQNPGARIHFSNEWPVKCPHCLTQCFFSPTSGDGRIYKPIPCPEYTVEELLNLPDEEIEALIKSPFPFDIKVGDEKIGGNFRIKLERMLVKLYYEAEMEGGENVIRDLCPLAERQAKLRDLATVRWLVDVPDLHKQTPRLYSRLEKLNFKFRDIPGVGKAYERIDPVGQ